MTVQYLKCDIALFFYAKLFMQVYIFANKLTSFIKNILKN